MMPVEAFGTGRTSAISHRL